MPFSSARSAFARLSLGLRLAGVGALFLGAAGLSACDTGFGQPCDLPETEEFRSACKPPKVDLSQEATGNDIVSSTKSSCAVRNFAGCETRVCLVYRDSTPFCSKACTSDTQCEGSAVCRPIIGDESEDLPLEELCRGTECYCVREGDLNN